MDYIINDRQLDAAEFVAFVNKVWSGSYDEKNIRCPIKNNKYYPT